MSALNGFSDLSTAATAGGRRNDDMMLFKVDEIEKTVKRLNKFNVFDWNGLKIMNFLHAHPAIFVSLKLLYNCMLRFGIVPKDFR